MHAFQKKKLPKSFLIEPVNTIVYVQNRLPTSAIKGMTTPLEAWGGLKPSLRYLGAFG